MIEINEHTESAKEIETENQHTLLCQKIKGELFSLIECLQYFNPALGKKLVLIGKINARLGNLLKIEDEEFYLAGYYANFSLLSMQNLAFKSEFLSKEEFEIYKRHTILSSDFLKEKGLLRASEFCLYHHENPDASGYFSKQNYPKESSLINIADNFENYISLNPYRPKYTLNEALEKTLSIFSNELVLTKLEVFDIREELIRIYNEGK